MPTNKWFSAREKRPSGTLRRMQAEGLELRPFLRVSKDESGREKSQDEQQDDLQKAGEREGFRLHKRPYREIGSASLQAKKPHDEFPKMITDLKTGTFGADGLALWEPSRGSRKVSE